MNKVNFAIGIHNHQPVGNFDFVFEDAYQKAYAPFLELLERHPKIRIAQHYSGILFNWLMKHKPEFMPRLKKLVDAGQIEMMTGGFYEPIMPVIPYRDKIGQIKKLTDFIKTETGYTARGMWLAERIWEPHLAKPCAEAGVKYVVLDDSHFKNAGLKDEELWGYYITEEEGHTLCLFPIAEKLRYTIPFQPPEKTIEYLRSIAEEDEERLVVFADDGEKFGIWPGTYEHCYENDWLEEFFKALDANAAWINLIHFSEVLEQSRPLGRIYLPTASYREMMEWAMPTQSIYEFDKFENILKEQNLHESYKVFVRGGFWRNFMVKYPESNNMHKKMTHVSQRLAKLEAKHSNDKKFKLAQDHLWAGQCNCPYWHGVFGGLYLSHLRFATYRELIQAENLLDEIERSPEEQSRGWFDYQVKDFDADGNEELLVSNSKMNLYFSPQNGGSLFELDFKPKAINLLDTLARREESYHEKLKQLSHESINEGQSQGEGVPSIHEMTVTKEEGLENLLFYDWYRRSSILDHFLAQETSLLNFSQCQYQEAGDFVNTAYEYSVESNDKIMVVKLWRYGNVRTESKSIPVYLEKKISLEQAKPELKIDYVIKNLAQSKHSFWFGSEFDFALLAGDAPDRYFVFPGHTLEDAKLRSIGEIASTKEAQLKDEWLGISVSVKVDGPATFWRFPIETVSQSESGFERIYQSSVVFPHWKFELDSNETWQNRLVLRVDELSL